MKIIKRSGAEVAFDLEKIIAAICKANNSVKTEEKLTDIEIDEIAEVVAASCEDMKRSPSVEEIQDLVENQLMKYRAYTMARNYSKRHKYFLFTFQIYLSKIILR